MIARNSSQYKAKTDLLSSTLKTAIFYMYNNGSCFYKGDKVHDRREEKMFQKADFCVSGCLVVDKSKSLAGLTITHAVYIIFMGRSRGGQGVWTSLSGKSQLSGYSPQKILVVQTP